MCGLQPPWLLLVCAAPRLLGDLRALARALSLLPHLASLELGACSTSLFSVTPLTRVAALRSLGLGFPPPGQHPPRAALLFPSGLAAMTRLTRLVVGGLGRGARSLAPLEPLTALQVLELEWAALPTFCPAGDGSVHFCRCAAGCGLGGLYMSHVTCVCGGGAQHEVGGGRRWPNTRRILRV